MATLRTRLLLCLLRVEEPEVVFVLLCGAVEASEEEQVAVEVDGRVRAAARRPGA